ncbi:MAG TPA: hypothetical protein VE476_09495 [Propionibacteriaceae bacterium]|nr:hypothetical protein [Propionibacteriaceae bacterium]
MRAESVDAPPAGAGTNREPPDRALSPRRVLGNEFLARTVLA